MKKYYLLLIVAFTSLICSCIKDPGLNDEFADMEWWIDMSQHNRFNERYFYNDWKGSKMLREVYVDGVLQSSEDRTDFWGKESFTLNKDHTIAFNGTKGDWLYSHNCLMFYISGGYNWYEVLECKPGFLRLRQEQYPEGAPFTPYYKDKSGKHRFSIFEYKGTE